MTPLSSYDPHPNPPRARARIRGLTGVFCAKSSKPTAINGLDDVLGVTRPVPPVSVGPKSLKTLTRRLCHRCAARTFQLLSTTLAVEGRGNNKREGWRRAPAHEVQPPCEGGKRGGRITKRHCLHHQTSLPVGKEGGLAGGSQVSSPITPRKRASHRDRTALTPIAQGPRSDSRPSTKGF